MPRSRIIPILFLLLAALALMPHPAFAALGGLVPCGNPGQGQPDCNACHLLSLTQLILKFLRDGAFVVGAIALTWGGLLMALAPANPAGIAKGRKVMTNAGIGILILFFSWYVIDLIIKILAGGSTLQNLAKPWHQIECTAEKTQFLTSDQGGAFTGTEDSIPGITIGGGGAGGTTDRDVVNRALAHKSQIADAIRGTGLTLDQALALPAAESAMRRVCSGAGACGFMQIMPGTARNMGYSGTDADIRQALLDPANDQTNFDRGERYFAGLVSRYGEEAAVAAYNGGTGDMARYWNADTNPGALAKSNNCPGAYAYQCEWDSSGCWDTANQRNNGNASCTRNTGFQQTRELIRRYNAYRQAFQQRGVM